MLIPAQMTAATDVISSQAISGPTSSRDARFWLAAIASSFLRSGGHNVTCVEGGAEAVAAVSTSDFDIVLMDVRMPGMDGLEATRRIRALEGKRGRIPIVAVTTHTFAEQVAKCHEAGMNSHLGKPFSRDALLDATARAVQVGGQPVNRTRFIPAAPAAIAIGSDLMTLDLMTFYRTAGYLAPQAVANYLVEIANGGEALLRSLERTDARTCFGVKLAEAAHTLAGCAGMFGFARLAALCRQFEQGVRSAAPDISTVADGLRAAIEAALQAIQDRKKQQSIPDGQVPNLEQTFVCTA